MTEGLVHFFINIFGGLINMPFGKEIIIFVVSLMPILELRGGLIAATLLHVNPVIAFIICLIGNMIPIPFILWGITPLFNKLKTLKKVDKWVEKLEKRALKKKDKIEKAEFWGLMLFVGIPLPGTGAWTGCLIAALLNMNKKKSLFAACLGVLLAGLIMMIVSYGILGGIIN
ncbi:MAG: small multi-drug export protein [Firmicutes bacterium]|nr:small multi-drug export protein [Bacillota bacterium]